MDALIQSQQKTAELYEKRQEDRKLFQKELLQLAEKARQAEQEKWQHALQAERAMAAVSLGWGLHGAASQLP